MSAHARNALMDALPYAIKQKSLPAQANALIESLRDLGYVIVRSTADAVPDGSGDADADALRMLAGSLWDDTAVLTLPSGKTLSGEEVRRAIAHYTD